MFNFSAIHLCAFAPLREVQAGIDEPFQNGLPGIISFCLPVSVTPFHHPSFALPALRLSCVLDALKDSFSTARISCFFVVIERTSTPAGCCPVATIGLFLAD
jgi:hypothetical protein